MCKNNSVVQGVPGAHLGVRARQDVIKVPQRQVRRSLRFFLLGKR